LSVVYDDDDRVLLPNKVVLGSGAFTNHWSIVSKNTIMDDDGEESSFCCSCNNNPCKKLDTYTAHDRDTAAAETAYPNVKFHPTSHPASSPKLT